MTFTDVLSHVALTTNHNTGINLLLKNNNSKEISFTSNLTVYINICQLSSG